MRISVRRSNKINIREASHEPRPLSRIHRACFRRRLWRDAAAAAGRHAADTMMTAQIIHVPDLSGEALGPASGPAFAPRHSSLADGMTLRF
jgi:hypothetical protein